MGFPVNQGALVGLLVAGQEALGTIRWTAGATGAVSTVLFRDGLLNDSSFVPKIARNSAGNYTLTFSDSVRAGSSTAPITGVREFHGSAIYTHAITPTTNDGMDWEVLEDNMLLTSGNTTPTMVLGAYKRGTLTAADPVSGTDVLWRFAFKVAS